jgi:hypothetical protein
MFYSLPDEIITTIYIFDNTYKNIYEKSLEKIKILPKYIYSNENMNYFESYIYFNCFKYRQILTNNTNPSIIYLFLLKNN